MAEINAGAARTARLQALMRARPDLTVPVICSATGRARSTVYMWLTGKPKPIPELTIRLLEVTYPAPACEAAE